MKKVIRFPNAATKTAKESKKEFEAKIFPLMAQIDEVLPGGDRALFALAVTLGERIAEENDDAEERQACFEIMMRIVLASIRGR